MGVQRAVTLNTPNKGFFICLTLLLTLANGMDILLDPKSTNARELGALGFSGLEDVWTDCFDETEMEKFMSAHYMSQKSAEAQVASIDNYSYYYQVFKSTFDRLPLAQRFNEPLRILELGAGSGSATRALLDLFPNATVVASDFSLSMLKVLKQDLARRGFTKRTSLFQVNAENLNFAAGSFDLVVGAALLHHLFRPDEAIKGAGKILKPDGVAVFFEPFEAGMKVVSLIYQMALRDPRSFFWHPRFRRYLKRCVKHWQAMSMKPKSDPFFHGIDDKWMFTAKQFGEWAKASGFSQVEISALYRGLTPYREIIESHQAGSGVKRFPKWFWHLVDSVEESLSPQLKKDLLAEGSVVLTK